MHTSVLLLLLFTYGLAEPIRSGERIVGGSETTINQYPFMASMLFASDRQTYRQQCGGAIINNRSILSAAHCFSFPNVPAMYRTRLGSTFANSGGIVYNTALIINHPDWDLWTIQNDIAVIRLASTIIFSNTVQDVSISGPNYIVPDRAVVTAIGWGYIQHGGPASEVLRHVQIHHVDWLLCYSRYQWLLTNTMMCAGNIDIDGSGQCSQDSGGPLLHNNVLVGVTSFSMDPCDDPRYPIVNTRVSNFVDWIVVNV